MTVLAKYQRLETEGIWRPKPDAQRRDVIVSIGDATLTISTANGSALTHWSLPAIERLNPGEIPALYRPGEGSTEMLELTETEMISAVDKVLGALDRGGSRFGGKKNLATIAVGVAILAAAAIWLPGAVTRYTASLVPDVARAAIGKSLLSEMDRVAGSPCAAPAGLQALDRLEQRLFGDEPTQLVVLPSALTETAHLPGGTILIAHTLVEDYETPDVLSGYVLAEDVRRKTGDPLARMLEFSGFQSALVLLSQGRIPDRALERIAEAVVTQKPDPIMSPGLIERLGKADIPSEPYAYAIDFSGETTTTLIEANSPSQTEILEDGDWIALQRICEE